MNKQQIQEFIAQRVARELKNGDLVNLGIGLPTLVANYIPEDIHVDFHSENGFVGMGPAPEEKDIDPHISNAGGLPVSILDGGVFFDSAISFGIIRGGHVDATILGALQVDEKGNLASHMIPGKMVPGMGGAMDLVVGAKRTIVAMQHTAKGNPKIMKECTLPLTAPKAVDLIVTEMCVLEVRPEGLVMTELNPRFTVEDVQAVTEAQIIVADNLKEMN